jgi:beta-lactam-binding protein with PASTA domain
LGPPPKCTVPSLARTPLSVARSVLVLLQCKVGSVKSAFSATIAKGAVIKTAPRPGTYSQGTQISLHVSKGRKPRHKHKHRR